MSLSASCGAAPQKRTLSSLLAGRVVKRPKQDAAPRLQAAALQLLQQQQDLGALLREAGNRDPAASDGATPASAGPLLAGELRRRASQLGVPAAALAVKMTLERLTEIVGREDEDQHGGVLASSQRVQLGLLLESSRELMSQGALSPLLLWQEYRRDQTLPHLELVLRLHSHNILSLTSIIETDEDARLWLVSGMKALCGRTSRRDEETDRVRQEVMSTVVGVLVGSGFDPTRDPAAPDRRAPPLCCSVLDDMLSWLLDAVEDPQGPAAGAELWVRVLDASLCGASASAESLRRFFTHALTRTLTHKPRLTVSDAVALQKEWTFAKAERSLTALFRKLSVLSSVEQLLRHLQRVLETHEVNWKNVLSFLSTLLVYNPGAQSSLTELLSRLLSSAFQGYDLENMITAFLLARQGALEGPAIFPSYSTWFKMSFGGGSCLHAGSKKSVVFLLKFLSDLVPFEPSQYLKVHVLQPPYVRAKHRSLLMEYVSLAKTRLADLQEAVEDMGLYEDAVGSGGAALQPQCQAVQDVERAVSLFESTGRISATVMEASIFRRPYFLAWFLSALLTPRTLPVKADARMSFIEALRKADKIPAAQHSSYLESCRQQRQQHGGAEGPDASDEPLELLKKQLQDCSGLLGEGRDGEMSAQLSRVSHTLSAIFPGRPDEPVGRTVIELHTSVRTAPELHVRAVNVILRSFCRCVLEASRGHAPSSQSPWASRFVGALLGNPQLVSGLLPAVWDLFHNQAALLSPAHLLGLAAFVVHLHAATPRGPLVLLAPPTARPEPVGVAAALSSALVCGSHADMLFCVRLCVAAVCYGVSRGGRQQDYIPHSLYKKLLFLIPRLVPEARGSPACDHQGARLPDLWAGATEASATWRTTAWRLWRHPAFRQLEHEPQYQLSFSEWLDVELQVQRSEDALTDPERQQYQQWACCQLYLPRPVQHGGCGGDSRALCSHLFSAVMEQQLSNQERPRGSCLPDLLARLQEVVYDMEVTDRSCDFLLDLLSQRCSRETNQQLTLNAWNRVLLSLPAVLLVKVKSEGGGASLDCDALIEHVNLHQRKACSPAGLLSCHLTSHLLRGLLGASARCRLPGEEVNRIWSQISQRCPLLLLSTAHWWECVSPVLSSLWSRLCDGAPLPEQLQLLSDCHTWACSLGEGLPSASEPAAGALLLAASLHRAWSQNHQDHQHQNHQDHQDHQDQNHQDQNHQDQNHQDHQDQRFTNALKVLQPETSTQHRQVLVFLLFLCVQDQLTSLLYPQGRSRGAAALCGRLLAALVDSADWLLLFQPHDQGVYQLVAMATSDEMTRLMPWAFYSLLLPCRVELLQRAALCPGFLATAVLCYLGLLRLHLDGRVTTATGEPHQAEPSRILSGAKQFLLRAAPQAPPTALCSSRLRQLRPQCADLDPEVAAALATHLDPHALSPEMDFL